MDKYAAPSSNGALRYAPRSLVDTSLEQIPGQKTLLSEPSISATVSPNHGESQPHGPPNTKLSSKRAALCLRRLKEISSCLFRCFYGFLRHMSKVTWLKELISLVLAMIALAIIILILATHQEKIIPRWPSLISINSLVSIFSSIFKAAMIFPVTECISELKWAWLADPHPLGDIDRFDSASRGSLGALRLFIKPRSILASFGASIIIIALAIDPFVQQVLRYYSCLQHLEGTLAVITRTNNYTNIGSQLFSNEFSTDDPMAAAIYQGLLDPPANASSSTSISCLSGNCTFPHANGMAYSSLAMCASVKDISPLISRNGRPIDNDDPALQESSPVFQDDDLRFNFSIPLGSASLSTCPNKPPPMCPEYGFTCADVTNLQENIEERAIFSFNALMFKNYTTPWAIEASLYPCVHVYSGVEVSKAAFQEHVTSTARLPFMNMTTGYGFSLAGDHPAFPGTDCTPSTIREGNKTRPTSLYNNGLRYVNRSFADTLRLDTADPDIMWYDPACTYEFGFEAYISLLGRLEGFFGTVSNARSLGLDGSGDTYLQRLYANGTADLNSAEAFMQGLADAITGVMRRNGDSTNSAPATGDTLINSTCIRIEWAWLALPMSLLLLTLIFFIATVVKSRRLTKTRAIGKSRKAWKSSILPLLWCGLDYETRKQYEGFDDLQTMKDCADKVKVRLVRRDEEGDVRGWKLKQQ